MGGLRLGTGLPPLVVAEIGTNHGGRMDLAEAMVRAAAAAGAHVVKLQTYLPELLLAPGSPDFEAFARENIGPEGQERLFALAESLGLEAISTPFDLPSLEFLVASGRPALKIASCDLTNLPLLRAAGGSGLPVVLSTGAGQAVEVEAALGALDPEGCREIILLHCTVAYPAPDADANLRRMEALARRFGRPVGFSDHTEGVEIALAAAALGAVLIEKHFTTDRTLPGGDNAMSLLPGELAALVAGAARIFAALGEADPAPAGEVRSAIRRSPVALRDIPLGEPIGPGNTALLRPGTGLSPAEYEALIGRPAAKAIARGAQLRREWIT